jgi:hypothetical protein
VAERDDGFARRWSRRKERARELKRQEPPSEAPPPEAAKSETPAETPAESETETPAESEAVAGQPGLPEIESLGRDDDFTVFLGEGVPEALRRRALRHLWRLDPVLANLDGLNDYDEDFTKIVPIREAAEALNRLLEKDEVVAEAPSGAPPATSDAEETVAAELGDGGDPPIDDQHLEPERHDPPHGEDRAKENSQGPRPTNSAAARR